MRIVPSRYMDRGVLSQLDESDTHHDVKSLKTICTGLIRVGVSASKSWME